jgi:hypothetical protein
VLISGFGAPPAHGDAHAGTAEVDARAGGELAAPHQVVCQIRWENGDIERVVGLDSTLEVGSKFVTDHKPVSGCVFELGGKLSENATRRRTAENSDLGGLRWAAMLGQSQCSNGSSCCRGRDCLNTDPHCVFPIAAHSVTPEVGRSIRIARCTLERSTVGNI